MQVIKKGRYSQKGFSLIQVMIVGALLASLSLTGMKMMANQMKAGRKLDSESDLRQMKSMVMGLMARAQTCQFALEGVSKGDDLNSLQFSENATPMLSVGELIGNSGYEVQSLKVLSNQEAKDADLEVSQNIFHVRLGIHQTRQTVGGKDKFVYFSVAADVGMISILEDVTESAVRSECENIRGKLEDDEVIVENTSGGLPRYTGICHYPEGEMILSCGI